MKFSITVDSKQSIQSIQREFADKLSPKEIRKTTAFALNTTARRVISLSRKEIKKEYTVNNKYLDRMAKLSKPASGSSEGLYAEVSYSYKTIPMIGFKNKDNNKSKSAKRRIGGVTVEIKHGVSKHLKHAFIATMASGHKGIFAVGSYVDTSFVYDKERSISGKNRITQLRTSSPMTMTSNKNIQKRTIEYIDLNLPSRLRALLQNKVNKLTK